MKYDELLQVLPDVLTEVQNLCDKEEPLKHTYFVQKFKLNSSLRLLHILQELGIIECIVKGKANEGSIYEWKFKAPENVSRMFLPTKILERYKQQQADYSKSKKKKVAKAKNYQIAKKVEIAKSNNAVVRSVSDLHRKYSNQLQSLETELEQMNFRKMEIAVEIRTIKEFLKSLK